MAKICAVVMNSISRDARVLKEAASLREAGHDVTIVGVADKNFFKSVEVLPNGVTVLRADLNRLRSAFNNITQFFLFALVATFLLFAIIKPGWAAWALVPVLLVTLWLAFSSLRRAFGIKTTRSGPRSLNSSYLKAVEIIHYLAKYVKGPAKVIVRSVWLWVRIIPLINLMREQNPDVVHCHDVHTLLIGTYIKKRTGCKMVYDAHEIYEETPHISKIQRFYCSMLHRLARKSLDGFITINESIADWYATHYPSFPKAVIIMNATQRIAVPQDDGRLRAAANVPAGKKILLYQGGYATHRGLPYLLNAAAHLPSDWVLVMMGWGTYEDTLRNIAGKVNAERGDEVIRFIPPAPQAELAAWTAGGTIGVIPYENTGLNHWFCTPNKLWEYPNAAVPVLVSPFPELRRPVEAYGYGWVLPENQDPVELGTMIGKLTDAEIAKAKANCMPFLEANHWGIYAERLVEAYRGWVGARA